jgi:transposase-like protein
VARKMQRYRCTVCDQTFTKAKKYIYSPALKEFYVKQHIANKSSYRDLAKNKYINRNRICEWVNEYGANAKTAKEMSQDLKPKWSGYIVVDGKIIRVKGEKHSLVVGVDYTGDIPVAEYEDGHENKSQYLRLFQSLKEIDYPLKGVISDGNPDILEALREIYPIMRHQICLRHFVKNIERSFGYLSVVRQGQENKFVKEIELKNIIYGMVYADNYHSFLNDYWYLKKRQGEYKTIYCRSMWAKVEFAKVSITAHFFDSKLHLTNNLAENVIKQLNRRLKTIEGFQSEKTAEGYLRLLVAYWRFRLYTDSRYKDRNGKSRLQVAGVDTSKLDWLRCAQRV